jgi:hypothetical protein
MRTAAAYISKLKTEVLGRTYKVQSTNNRLETNNIYRGRTECKAIDYTQIIYTENQKCGCVARIVTKLIYHGGNSTLSGSKTLDGGTPLRSGSTILNAGSLPPPVVSVFFGGDPSMSGSVILNGGNPGSSGIKPMNGGSP